jgi:hypothetical protein
VKRLDISPLEDTEPFAFREGISQLLIAEFSPPDRLGPRLHTMQAGEFVLGYQNQRGRPANSPTAARPPIPPGPA